MLSDWDRGDGELNLIGAVARELLHKEVLEPSLYSSIH